MKTLRALALSLAAFGAVFAQAQAPPAPYSIVSSQTPASCKAPATLFNTTTQQSFVCKNGTFAEFSQYGPQILQARVTITSAQILAMTSVGTAPITLIPAPGAGKIIVPFSYNVEFNAGTTPYTSQTSLYGPYFAGFPAGQNFGSLTPDEIGMTGSVSFSNLNFVGIADATSHIANLPLVFAMQASGDAATSGGNGTLTVTVAYFLISA